MSLHRRTLSVITAAVLFGLAAAEPLAQVRPDSIQTDARHVNRAQYSTAVKNGC